MSNAPSVAASIERRLALEILRGERLPGSSLPPVRHLAATLKVTPPTIQRVIDRLESAGLVTARRGSGVTVKDPKRCADLAMLPLWFEAYADQPDRATKILGDFLEVRRVLARHMVMTAPPQLMMSPNLAPRIAAAFEAETVSEIAACDAELTAALVEESGQFALASIMHLTSRLVLDAPLLAEAFFGDRARYRKMLRAIGKAFLHPQRDDVANAVDEAFRSWDERTLRLYRAALDRSARS